LRSGCDSLVAIGGGSPIDCAKVIAAKAANPQPISAYEGFLSVSLFGLYGRPPPLVAVPTTAGSGAETTIAAVITLEEQCRKITIADPELVPRVAIFDPLLIKGLPQAATAATGMDALTHAVESFLSGWSTRSTRALSLSAVESIAGSLTTCYEQGEDLRAREAMLRGSFDAGLAFTRASVGYVHAIAHQFGAIFHTAHGEANAMLLPLVLDFYLQGEAPGSALSESLCQLGIAAGVVSEAPVSADARHRVAQLFVAHVQKMNQDMNLPREVPELRAEDVHGIAVRALREAHGRLHGLGLKWLLDLGYPVPKEMDLQRCQEIVAACLPANERLSWKASKH
jgi:alcohol dehydrogenase class IV